MKQQGIENAGLIRRNSPRVIPVKKPLGPADPEGSKVVSPELIIPDFEARRTRVFVFLEFFHQTFVMSYLGKKAFGDGPAIYDLSEYEISEKLQQLASDTVRVLYPNDSTFSPYQRLYGSSGLASAIQNKLKQLQAVLIGEDWVVPTDRPPKTWGDYVRESPDAMIGDIPHFVLMNDALEKAGLPRGYDNNGQRLLSKQQITEFLRSPINLPIPQLVPSEKIDENAEGCCKRALKILKETMDGLKDDSFLDRYEHKVNYDDVPLPGSSRKDMQERKERDEREFPPVREKLKRQLILVFGAIEEILKGMDKKGLSKRQNQTIESFGRLNPRKRI